MPLVPVTNGVLFRVISAFVEGNGAVLEVFARTISGLAGGQVNARTGLSGRYDVAVRFADPRVSSSDAPRLVQALQGQFGLALYPEKTTVQLFVIDHIEPPTVDQ